MRLLLLLAAVALVAVAAPAKQTHELVARLPRSSSLYNSLTAQNYDVFGIRADTIDVRLTQPQLDTIVKRNSIDASKVKILIEDLDQLIQDERNRLSRSLWKGSVATDADYHAEYHRYEDVKQFIAGLAANYPEVATFVPSIGKSVEKRDLFQVRITAPGDASDRQAIFIQAQLHAREWIAGATAQYLADQLVQGFQAKDPRVVSLLSKLVFVITPIANPDGYVYTWTNDRLWRKNRARVEGELLGVDINRNWPFAWALEPGSSPNPYSQTYQGPSAGSEPEVQALIRSYNSTKNVIGALDLHSFSEVVLYPNGYADVAAPDEAELVKVASSVVNAIASVQGTKYNMKTKMYPVSGTSRDWFYNVGHAYGLTIELSPNEDDEVFEFILPPTEIRRVGKELWNGLLAYAETLLTLPKPRVAH